MLSFMARPLRIEYSGAVYHVMARGDGGKFIFNDDSDALLFLKWLGEVCESHGWKVHAWVLMGNHFHLLLETPEPNLIPFEQLNRGNGRSTAFRVPGVTRKACKHADQGAT